MGERMLHHGQGRSVDVFPSRSGRRVAHGRLLSRSAGSIKLQLRFVRYHRVQLGFAERPAHYEAFLGEVVAPRMRAYRLGDLADVFAQERGVAVRVIGARAGEKLHEDLVSKDEALTARTEGDFIVIDARRAGAGMSPTTSADAERVSATELRELMRSW